MGTLRNNRGFTLVELLVVLSIIALIMSIATINKSQLVLRYRFNTVLREMVNDLRYAQSKAIIDGKSYRIEFTSNKRYTVREEASPVYKTIKEVILPPEIEVHYNRSNRLCLFNTDGTESYGGGTVTLYSKGLKKEITIVPITGRIAIVR